MISKKVRVAIRLLFGSDPLMLLKVSKGFGDGCDDGALLSIVFTCMSGYVIGNVVIKLREDRFNSLKRWNDISVIDAIV